MRKTIFPLKSSQDIQSVRQNGNSFSNGWLVLVAARNELDASRAAIIASRSVGGAVQRNRCKRVLRARLNRFSGELRQGFDILLIARKRLLDAKPVEIDQAVHSLLVKAGLINRDENG
ncbi:MAG: ribonuclease P protein component [Anaerolineaceae bacterium]|nr:ribonuclease P protein component [Chloroflexota bacterium]